jgi:hypothetical protein
MKVELPEDYPLSPPGVNGNLTRILVEAGLRYRGYKPADYYEGHQWAPPGWAWWCYQKMEWNPGHDNLVSLLELVRTDMSKP